VAAPSSLTPKYKIISVDDGGLQSKILSLCRELQAFLDAHGPEPKVEKQSSEEFHAFMERFRNVVLPWRTQFHGDYRRRFADRVASVWDEIRAKCGQSDFTIDKAISLAANSPNGEIEAVQQIIQKLWNLAREVN
jgi:hypothetical protein